MQVSCSKSIYMLWHSSFSPSCTLGKHNDPMQWTSGHHKLHKTRRHSTHSSCQLINRHRHYPTSRTILLFRMAPCQGSKSLYPQPGPTPPDPLPAVKAAQVTLSDVHETDKSPHGTAVSHSTPQMYSSACWQHIAAQPVHNLCTGLHTDSSACIRMCFAYTQTSKQTLC